MEKMIVYARTHLVLSIVAVAAIVGSAYGVYTTYIAPVAAVRYTLTTVQEGALVESVDTSGQVSASATLSLKAKVSGDITSVPGVAGSTVRPGQLIAVIDPTSAAKAVRDAEVNLASAKIALEKVTRPTDTLTLIQAQNALADAQSKLDTAYDDGFTAVSNAFLSLPTTMAGLENVLYGYDASPSKSQSNSSVYTDLVNSYDSTVLVYRDDAEVKYKAARKAYDATFLKYRSLTRTSERTSVEALILETFTTTKLVADALKSSNDFLGFVKDRLTARTFTVPAILTTHAATLNTYTSTTNTGLQSLVTVKNTFASSRNTITEKTQLLTDLADGSDSLDIQTAELSVTRSQNALRDAQNALGDYYIRAPFAGTLATVGVKRYDTVGTGLVIGTVITPQKIAELSLNEVDAAKVSVGDSVALTFDAIEGSELVGTVAEVDAVGTVTQGVVSYKVQVSFDARNTAIKSGMTVSASIETDSRARALTVPTSAIKTEKGVRYVLAFEPPQDLESGVREVTTTSVPVRITVTTGISDSTNTEILSGLKKGQQIVQRSSAAATAATAATTARPAGGRPF